MKRWRYLLWGDLLLGCLLVGAAARTQSLLLLNFGVILMLLGIPIAMWKRNQVVKEKKRKHGPSKGYLFYGKRN